MIAVEPGRRRKIMAAVRLLSSDKPGEALAAFEAVSRLLPDGLTLVEVVEAALVDAERLPCGLKPIPVDPSRSWTAASYMSPWRRQAKGLLSRGLHWWTESEITFLRSMAARRDEPTVPQAKWLAALCSRCDLGKAA